MESCEVYLWVRIIELKLQALEAKREYASYRQNTLVILHWLKVWTLESGLY